MLRRLAKSNSELPELFYKPLRHLHWIHAGVVLTGLITVGVAVNLNEQKSDEARLRRRLMFIHKSCGLFIFMSMPIRLYWAAAKDRPPHYTQYGIMKSISTGTHLGLHAGLIFMSTTGFLMLLYAGESWPFFLGSVPNPQPFGKDKDTSNSLRKIHKAFGSVWAWLVPLHIAGVSFHVLQGERILHRMNPFV